MLLKRETYLPDDSNWRTTSLNVRKCYGCKCDFFTAVVISQNTLNITLFDGFLIRCNTSNPVNARNLITKVAYNKSLKIIHVEESHRTKWYLVYFERLQRTRIHVEESNQTKWYLVLPSVFKQTRLEAALVNIWNAIVLSSKSVENETFTTNFTNFLHGAK